MQKYFIAFILLPMLLLASGCTSSKDVEITGYTVSVIKDDFPVPENAKQLETTTNSSNPNIKISVEYELKNIGGEQGLYVPERYFQEIKDSGWTELEDKRMGHLHFFEKDNTVMALEIREDTFEISEMIKDAKF